MDKDARRKCGKVRRALFHLLLIVGGATGWKDQTINVPPMVRSGDTVILTCTYDLEGSLLYSVQWFLNGVEFYRYKLKQEPPYCIYDNFGIYVNLTESDMNSVTLMNVSRKLSGTYKCEVSADSPTYYTSIKTAIMEVVDAPKTDPTIGIEKDRIAVGETLKANCTSGASHPATAITWTLNGKPISSDSSQHSIRSYSIPQDDDNMVTVSHIMFKIANDMFKNGRLSLRCTTFISDVYRKSIDTEISVDEPLIASITGDASPHSHTESSASSMGIDSIWLSATTLALTTILALVATTSITASGVLPMTSTKSTKATVTPTTKTIRRISQVVASSTTGGRR